MAMWSPWRGCHRCSEGCRYCYIHKGDARRGVDTDSIVRSEKFDAPIARPARKTANTGWPEGRSCICASRRIS